MAALPCWAGWHTHTQPRAKNLSDINRCSVLCWLFEVKAVAVDSM